MSKLFSSKIIKLFLGAFIFFLISYLLLDGMFGISDRVELQITTISAGFLTAVFIIVILIADILIPIPASIVMVASGMLFGGFLGGVITLTGSLIAALINFQISRILGQARIKRWLGEKEYDSLSMIMEKYGTYILILTRMVPLVTEATSAIAGISQMNLRRFIILNIVGFVPIVFFYSYTGSLYKEQPSNIFLILFVGFLVPLLIWYVFLKMSKAKLYS